MPVFRSTFPLILVLLATLAASLPAQSPPPLPATPARTPPPTRQTAMSSLVETIGSLEQQIAEVKAKLAAKPTAPEVEALSDKLRAAERELADKQFDLLTVATNVDLSAFQSVEAQPFSLQGSLEDLVRPLIEEIKRATEDSREAQKLRDRYEIAQERGIIVGRALAALDRTVAATDDPAVLDELRSLREMWGKRHEDLMNEINVLGFQIAEVDSREHSLLGQTSSMVSRFFQKRGRNLLFAFLAAVVVFAGLRFLRMRLHERTTFLRRDRSTTARLLDVALYFSAFLAALAAAVIVLVIAGDWVLVGFATLILIGLILSTKDTLPGYADEIRLILNLGSVRERERIVYNGVPWLVEKLTFFTILRNPALRGGMLRMPVSQLVGMISRPTADKEPYFPCDEGDWVLLDDSTYGRVIFQSVEMVRLVLLGGAQKTYATESFLGQNPQNFAHDFRIRTTIGIDYSHQTAATGDFLEKLNAFYKVEVYKLIDHELVRSIKVEFALASASSLDYEVQLDVAGELAARYQPLTRALQRIGVDACNKFNLVIPFQQITIHQ